MAHYLLIYDVADEYEARRTRVRDAHLRAAWHARTEVEPA
jgi:hypothetical protein